ncbi:MAG: exodeoxyribonuclease VII large subunit [Candidatus Binatia bacterium]
MRGPAAAAPRILTVSELARRLRGVLEREFPRALWVAGELSNWKRHTSGHCYFTLKDEESQLRCAMFQRAARTLIFDPHDGMDVVAAARVDLYPVRGDLQLIVEAMEPRGLGALRLAFEQLKAKLQAEGLFAAERKRPLPRFPQTIGIVTALTGAAVHDLRTTLRRRWPQARVLVRPVRVQGEGAAAEIAAAVADFARVPEVDVLIVGRGGGSLEDLWAFNEEVVARAIAAAPVPVISAVGHEVDFTIADFVADARASTPTGAAVMATPDRIELVEQVTRTAQRLVTALRQRVRLAGESLTRLERALGDPRRRVQDVGRRVDELAVRSRRALVRRIAWDRRELGQLAQRLERGGPAARVARVRADVTRLRERLEVAVVRRLEQSRAAAATRGATLQALSPLACLDRGYAIVRRGGADGPVVRDAAVLAPGDAVALRFARGEARARVESTTMKDKG